MKRLVLWSSGIESTSLLKHLLETTDDVIEAHCVIMDNPERSRLEHEYMAIIVLYRHLYKIRPFELSFSSISIQRGAAFPIDWQTQYPIGIIAARHSNCQQVLRAGCLEDEYERTRVDGMTVYTLPEPELGKRHRLRAANFQFMLPAHLSTDQLMPYLDLYANTKAWHVEHLGELAPLTWSCRLPVDGKECGLCHSCQERTAAFAGTSAVPEIRTAMKK